MHRCFTGPTTRPSALSPQPPTTLLECLLFALTTGFANKRGGFIKLNEIQVRQPAAGYELLQTLPWRTAAQQQHCMV